MKKVLFFIALIALSMTACNKANDGVVTPSSTTTTTTIYALTLAGLGGTPIPETDVPQSVKDSIALLYPGYTITKVERDTERNVAVYEIHINNGTLKKTLYYNVNWTLIAAYLGNDHHTGGDHRDSTILVSSLPQPVQDSIARFYAGYTITKAEIELKNGVTTYEIHATNGTLKITLVYDATGHLILNAAENNKGEHGGDNNHNGNNDHNNGLKLTDVPTVVNTYIATNYAGYKIDDAEKKIVNGVTTYEIEIKMGNTEKTLIFDASWVFVKVK
jgi:uncharacterized membrane protein YkoI